MFTGQLRPTTILHRRENRCEVPSCTEMVQSCTSLRIGYVQNPRYKFLAAPYWSRLRVSERYTSADTPEAPVADPCSTPFGRLRESSGNSDSTFANPRKVLYQPELLPMGRGRRRCLGRWCGSTSNGLTMRPSAASRFHGVSSRTSIPETVALFTIGSKVRFSFPCALGFR